MPIVTGTNEDALAALALQPVDAPLDADDNIAGLGTQTVDITAAAAAAAAGVYNAAFIDYANALEAYESRSDVETLAHKNARNAPDTFADADFMRSVAGGTSSGV